MRWIPINEQKPRETAEVEAWVVPVWEKEGFPLILRYRWSGILPQVDWREMWSMDELEPEYYTVTHWRPRPPGPAVRRK